ncbi:hypothetical protein HK405_006697 [Cladochytrium tenue]|nr:hypothetical protein HK405_006697 [Cladochytrium tenue]
MLTIDRELAGFDLRALHAAVRTALDRFAWRIESAPPGSGNQNAPPSAGKGPILLAADILAAVSARLAGTLELAANINIRDLRDELAKLSAPPNAQQSTYEASDYKAATVLANALLAFLTLLRDRDTAVRAGLSRLAEIEEEHTLFAHVLANAANSFHTSAAANPHRPAAGPRGAHHGPPRVQIVVNMATARTAAASLPLPKGTEPARPPAPVSPRLVAPRTAPTAAPSVPADQLLRFQLASDARLRRDGQTNVGGENAGLAGITEEADDAVPAPQFVTPQKPTVSVVAAAKATTGSHEAATQKTSAPAAPDAHSDDTLRPGGAHVGAHVATSKLAPRADVAGNPAPPVKITRSVGKSEEHRVRELHATHEELVQVSGARIRELELALAQQERVLSARVQVTGRVATDVAAEIASVCAVLRAAQDEITAHDAAEAEARKSEVDTLKRRLSAAQFDAEVARDNMARMQADLTEVKIDAERRVAAATATAPPPREVEAHVAAEEAMAASDTESGRLQAAALAAQADRDRERQRAAELHNSLLRTTDDCEKLLVSGLRCPEAVLKQGTTLQRENAALSVEHRALEVTVRQLQATVDTMMKFPDASLGQLRLQRPDALDAEKLDGLWQSMINANTIRIALLEQKNHEYRLRRCQTCRVPNR